MNTIKNRIIYFMFAVFCIGNPCVVLASDNTFWGTGVGAALGGLVGSQIGKGSGKLAATGAGVFLGGLMGNSVGHSLDRADGRYAGSYYTPAPYYPSSYDGYAPTYVAPPPATSVVYAQPQTEIIEYRPVQASSVYIQEGYIGSPPPPHTTPSRSLPRVYSNYPYRRTRV